MKNIDLINELNEFFERNKQNFRIWETPVGRKIKFEVQKRQNWKRKPRGKRSTMNGYRQMRYVVEQKYNGFEGTFEECMEYLGL